MAPSLPARIRRSYYILAFLVQGLISTLYVLISSMITWKFPDKSPFVVNEGFLLISIIAYPIMCFGFPLMVIFIVDYKHFRDSTFFQLLSACVFLAVMVAPIGLGCVVHIPAQHQWIGYGIIGLTACVVFFTGFGEYIIIWYKKLMGKRTTTAERAVKEAKKMKKVEDILKDATTNEEPLTRTYTCWWSMVYSFLGIYTMTDAPQIATVKLSFLDKFLLKLRKSMFLHTIALQGIISTSYGPIKVMINFKFKEGSPFDKHGPYMYIANCAYGVVILGFMIIVFLIHDEQASPRKGSGSWFLQHALNVIVMTAIIIVPISLIMTVLPDKLIRVGYVILVVVSSLLLLFFIWVRWFLRLRSDRKSATGESAA